jgi:glycyl-tRNA synthetase beta chain
MNDVTSDSLLVELLTEELPPRSLKLLSEAFGAGLLAALKQLELADADSAVSLFATPRRLAAIISRVHASAPKRVVREKILPLSVAFDSAGNASAPLIKKLAALGVPDIDPATLERASDGKSETLYLTRELPGAVLAQVASDVIEGVIKKLPIAKLMNYQINAGTPSEATIQFARPAHGLVVLHGKELIKASALGLESCASTLGHRFLSSGPVNISSAGQYEATLEAAFVIASFAKRRAVIEADLQLKARPHLLVAPPALLDEVTALVEWPVVYAAQFDHEFLRVPQECLILTMQQNQKYFALTDADGQMVEHFLLVSNLATDDASLIVHGNERVLRARLADAKFIFEQDKKHSLFSRLERLGQIVYFKKLGTLGERVQRIEILARELAESQGSDLAQVTRAAALCKADLVTDMVGEFPELQGTMGRYYALNDAEDAVVADAIAQHYRPRFATDVLPDSTVATCVALADKLETLAGFFAVGEIPTGERDPYGLRRAALGVLRMLTDGKFALQLTPWLMRAVGLFAARIDGPRDMAGVTAELQQFIFDRLRGLLRERGFSADEIDSVLSQEPQRVDQVMAYLEAVRTFALLPEAQSLASANKRIGNILKKNPAGALVLDASLYQEPAEHQLGLALAGVTPTALASYQQGDYTGMLRQLALLRDPVDHFFAEVMVMSDDARLRQNRLALLSELHQLMNRFADLSRLAAQ